MFKESEPSEIEEPSCIYCGLPDGIDQSTGRRGCYLNRHFEDWSRDTWYPTNYLHDRFWPRLMQIWADSVFDD